MTVHVSVPLPESTYRRVKELADLNRQSIAETIAEYLTDSLLPIEAVGVPAAEEDAAVEREKEAWIRLHPQLKSLYFGRYVAIYGGELIDHDQSYAAILERVDERYPDDFVWVAKVENEAMGTLYFRSPRFVEDD